MADDVEKIALAELPDDLAQAVRHHIREMYPAAVEAAPSTFLLSVGNHVRNQAHMVIAAYLAYLKEQSA